MDCFNQSQLRGILINFSSDERLGHLQRNRIFELLGGSFHEIRSRAVQRTAQTAIQGQFGAANRVDDNPGRVWGIPNFQLGFDV